MQRTSIRESNCVIHWIEIHLVDSIIYLLNKWRQKSYHHLPACHFLFYCQGLYTEASWSQLQELQVQTHNMTISLVALFFIVTSNGSSVILHCLVPSP